MPTPELDVLKPIDPSINTSDDYEIFILSNATVVYKSNGKLANLLSAYADTPLKVEGRLEKPSSSQMKYLVSKPYKPVDLDIRDVTRFSYGQTTDGEMMIWALGSAGWFEIRPSKAYKEIYEEMVQAVEILYFVTDIYNEPRKRGGGPTAELIFREFAEDERFGCESKDEAEATFYKHRAFLIMCFLNRAQGLGWSNTPLYQHFKLRFPREWETSKARVEGKFEAKPTEKPSKPSPPAAPKPKVQAKDTGKAKTQEKEAPKKDDNWWESAAIFEFMQKAMNQGAVHRGRITIERVAKLFVKRYEIDDVDMATNVILVHARNLCYMMAHRDRRKKDNGYFLNEPIHAELSAGHSLSAADVRRAEGVELRPRKNYSTMKEDVSSSEEASSSDDAETATTTPRRRPLGKHQEKGQLSVLRPRSSKYSGKGKGVKPGKGKGKKNVQVYTSDESDAESSDAAVDTPTQALSPGKRAREIEEREGDERPRKRTHSQSESPESVPSSPASTPPDDAITDSQLPLRWKDKNSNSNSTKTASNALLPPIISTPLPTYTANGPGDSWICTFDGCSQKIYGASMEQGGALIKDHLADHARGRAFEIGLVMSEEQRLRLPVSNLIKRIREMAERQQSLFPTGAPMRPSSIERTV